MPNLHTAAATCDGCAVTITGGVDRTVSAPPPIYGSGATYTPCPHLPDGTWPCRDQAEDIDREHLSHCRECNPKGHR